MVVTNSSGSCSSRLKRCPAFHSPVASLQQRQVSNCRTYPSADVRHPFPTLRKRSPGSQGLSLSCSHALHNKHFGSQPRRYNRLVCTSSAAGAAALPASPEEGVYGRAANPDPGPRSLPPPPRGSGLLQVLPYLARLAATDPQLYWRLGVASVLLIISKAAGILLMSRMQGQIHKHGCPACICIGSLHRISW